MVVEHTVCKKKAASSTKANMNYRAGRYIAKMFRVVTSKKKPTPKPKKKPIPNCTYKLEAEAKVGKWGGQFQFWNTQNEQRKGESINP